MKYIAIIGAGQLGSRHLQGALKSELSLHIQVADISQESLTIAKARAEEIERKQGHTVTYLDNIGDLNNELDLVILATSARGRADLLQHLIQSKTIKNIVVEKVAFQSDSEFDQIIPLIGKYKINTWVNCSRRLFPFYQQLKQKLKGESITINIHAGNWGLACNAVHMMDLFYYMCDKTNDTLETYNQGLLPEIVESKRNSYYEVNGVLVASYGSNRLIMSCTKSDEPEVFSISSASCSWLIDESKHNLVYKSLKNGWEPEYLSVKITDVQSNLTGPLIESILVNGNSDLPTLQESYLIHSPLINSLLTHFNKYGDETFDKCPIT